MGLEELLLHPFTHQIFTGLLYASHCSRYWRHIVKEMDKLHTLVELTLHSKVAKNRGFGVQLSNPSSIQLLQKLGSESTVLYLLTLRMGLIVPILQYYLWKLSENPCKGISKVPDIQIFNKFYTLITTTPKLVLLYYCQFLFRAHFSWQWGLLLDCYTPPKCSVSTKWQIN